MGFWDARCVNAMQDPGDLTLKQQSYNTACSAYAYTLQGEPLSKATCCACKVVTGDDPSKAKL